MSHLEQIFLYFFKLLRTTLFFGVSLTYLLNFSSLYLHHSILHFYLLLVIRSIYHSLSFFLSRSITIFLQKNLLFTLNHLIIFVESDKLTTIVIIVSNSFHFPKRSGSWTSWSDVSSFKLDRVLKLYGLIL